VTPCNTYFTESEKIGRLKTSAEEPVQNLQSVVNSLVSGSGLNQGQGNSLNSKLNAALSAFDRQNSLAASNVLGAFIDEAMALVRGSVLSSQQGDLLITPAIAIIKGWLIDARSRGLGHGRFMVVTGIRIPRETPEAPPTPRARSRSPR
jgi:hypothetical protein